MPQILRKTAVAPQAGAATHYTVDVVLPMASAPLSNVDTDIDHHDHNPFWSRSMLLGAFAPPRGVRGHVGPDPARE